MLFRMPVSLLLLSYGRDLNLLLLLYNKKNSAIIGTLWANNIGACPAPVYHIPGKGPGHVFFRTLQSKKLMTYSSENELRVVNHVKKILAVLLSMSILFVLAGCTSDEAGIYRTVWQMQSLKDYSFSGDLSASIQKLSVAASEDESADDIASETEQLNELKKELEGKSLLFSGNVSSTSDKFAFNLSTKSNDTTQNLFNLMTEPGAVYVNKDVADKYLPTECTYTTVTVNSVLYAKYDATDLLTTIENAQYADTEPQDNPYDTEQDTEPDLYNGYSDGLSAGYSDGYAGITSNDSPTDGESHSDKYNGAYADGYNAAYPTGQADAVTDAANRALSLQQYAPVLEQLLKLNDTTGEDLQNRINSLFEDVIGTFKDSPDLGIVTKSGDSTSKANLTVDAVTSALQKVFEYLSTHTTQLKGVLTRFVNGLSAEEFKQLFADEKKSDVLNSINSINGDTFKQTDADSGDSSGDDGQDVSPVQNIDTLAAAMAADFDTSRTAVQYTVTKTGSSSYDNTLVGTLVTADGNEFGLDADVSATLHFNINSGTPTLPTSVTDTSLQSAGGKLQFKVTDPNAVETGVLVSTSKTMSNPQRIKAAKSDSGYTVSLSGLTAGKQYYYQVYSVDNAGNLIKDTSIRSFATTTKAAGKTSSAPAGTSDTETGSNPDTGNPLPSAASVLLLAMAAGCVAFGARRRRAK